MNRIAFAVSAALLVAEPAHAADFLADACRKLPDVVAISSCEGLDADEMESFCDGFGALLDDEATRLKLDPAQSHLSLVH